MLFLLLAFVALNQLWVRSSDSCFGSLCPKALARGWAQKDTSRFYPWSPTRVTGGHQGKRLCSVSPCLNPTSPSGSEVFLHRKNHQSGKGRGWGEALGCDIPPAATHGAAYLHSITHIRHRGQKDADRDGQAVN